MARIHRDGQRRETHIYRLLTSGTIDESMSFAFLEILKEKLKNYVFLIKKSFRDRS